jgi:SH3 domain-containing YSC84-like protein 1
MKKKNIFIFVIIALLLLTTSIGYAQEPSREEARIDKSIEVFQEMTAKENQTGAMGELLNSARGIAIFPQLTKVGFGVGVQFGEGLVLHRDQQTENWYGPAFIEVKTATVGAQIGIQDVSLVLIIMDEAGINGFKQTDFELGANISISTGPTGESLQKDADFNDSIYSYSYSEGLYAGFTLEGSVIHADRSANQSFYGREIGAEEILENHEVEDESALKLIVEIEKVSQ